MAIDSVGSDRSKVVLQSFKLCFRTFAVSAPELWTKLPDDIRSCDNLNLFKRKLKTHLIIIIIICLTC